MSIPSSRGARWVFVDSSAYYALADRHDENYQRATAILTHLGAEQRRLFTTNFVLAETHSLLLARLGRDNAVRILAGFSKSPATTVIRVKAKDEARAWAIIRMYEDKSFSLIDAISFAVMERLRIPQAFTFDHHFYQYGVTVLDP